MTNVSVRNAAAVAALMLGLAACATVNLVPAASYPAPVARLRFSVDPRVFIHGPYADNLSDLSDWLVKTLPKVLAEAGFALATGPESPADLCLVASVQPRLVEGLRKDIMKGSVIISLVNGQDPVARTSFPVETGYIDELRGEHYYPFERPDLVKAINTLLASPGVLAFGQSLVVETPPASAASGSSAAAQRAIVWDLVDKTGFFASDALADARVYLASIAAGDLGLPVLATPPKDLSDDAATCADTPCRLALARQFQAGLLLEATILPTGEGCLLLLTLYDTAIAVAVHAARAPLAKDAAALLPALDQAVAGLKHTP